MTKIDLNCVLVFGHKHLANRSYFFKTLNEISWSKVHIPGNNAL